MIGINQKKFEEVLINLNLLSKENIEKAKIESIRTGQGIEEAIISLKLLDEEDVIKAVAISSNVPYVNLIGVKIDDSVLQKLPREYSKKYMAVPFGEIGSTLNVAMENPNNIQAIEFIERLTGKRVSPYMASRSSILEAINQQKDLLSQEVSDVLKSLDYENKENIKKERKSEANINQLVQDAPVTRAVNTILEYAVKSRASDIHIEPWEKELKIRYRIDGVLHETMTLPTHIHSALISRIKILSDLKIDEHRMPQDGRFNFNIEGHEIDVRVAVSPTVHGEKIVMRLLDKSAGIIDLESLGVRGRSYKLILDGIKSPHGMVLSTGPTGSGKTTTLYAILNRIKSPEVNIITLEDPVEYQVPGVNQIQVNAAIGLTFASGLRSILRQDPDIVMVGEIRDIETADLAVQSALTGHMVLSTVHTNSAAGVLPRLLDMKIEPFLISSTVNTVIGQRLVRKLCNKCKKAQKASPAQISSIEKTLPFVSKTSRKELQALGYPNIPELSKSGYIIYKGVGCKNCNNTGFEGRIGIFEVFAMNPEIEKVLLSQATTYQVQALAIKQGMLTMRQDGYLKALEGITTLEEVVSRASEI